MDQWRENEGLSSLIAAPVPEINVKKLLTRNNRRTMGAMAIYATLAAREALEDATVSEEMIATG